MFFTHFFNYFYIPSSGPWYEGNVWGNVFVVAVIAPLGWLWSKSKYWPLLPVKHGISALHDKFDAHTAKVDAHHARQHDHNEWMAKTLANMHREQMGYEAEQHPHFEHIGKQDG